MAVRKTGSQTTVNRGITAAAATPVNIISGTGGATVNISSVQIANSTFHVKDDLAIDTAGGYLIVNGTGFNSGAVVYVQGIAATSTAFVNSTRLNVTVPALSSGTLDVYVVNTDGSGSIYLRSLSANGVPSWTTTSPLTSQSAESPFSINLVATGAAGDGTIIYAVSSGSSLPTGTSLASNGYFYGTVTGLETETTYSFSVDAIDAQNQETARSFNITFSVSDSYFEYVTLLLSGNGTNGSNNNTFVDSSNNAFLITRNGNTTQGTFTPYGNNWSNYFDGTGDYLSVPDNVAFDFGTGSFTIEAWINTTVKAPSGENRCIVGTYGSGGNAWWISINSNGRIVYAVDPNLGSYTATKDVTDGLWHHVAMVRNGSSDLRLYIDGILDDSRTVSSSVNTNGTVNIGSLNPAFGLSYFWNGFISNVRVVKDTAVYTGNFTPSTSALTAITNTQLLTCQSNRLIDNSTNAFSITRNGDVSVQRFSPFSPTAAYASGTIGGSGYFDGTGDYLQSPTNATLALGTGDFCVECWVYISGGGVAQGFFQPTTDNLNVQRDISGNIGAWDGTTRTTSTPFLSNSWNHVAFTRSSSTARLFLNGVQATSWTSSVNYSTNMGFIIGYTGNGSFPITGYIGDFRVVKGSAVYTSGFTPPTAPLTAITNTQLLLNYTNAGIIDNAMMNVLETVGNAQISTTQSKFGGSSMYFDGSGDWLVAPSGQWKEFGAGAFTIECWFYITDNTTRKYIIGAGVDTGSHYNFALECGNSGKINMWASSDGSSWNLVTSDTSEGVGSTTIPLNQWNHVAMVRESSGTFKSYLNGTLQCTVSGKTAAIVSQPTQPVNIGKSAYLGTFSPFVGYIDDLRITKGVARYTSNFTAPTSSFSLK